MNINKLIKRLKDELGLSRFVKLSYTDKDIYDNIIVHSLEEWSHYFKQAVTFQNVELSAKLQLEYDVYAIPKYIIDNIRRSGLVIEDIRQVLASSDQAVAGVGTFVGAFLPDLNLIDSYTALYSNYRQGNAEAVNQMNIACYYEKPNKLRFVFPRPLYQSTTVAMSFYVSQGDNLSGISETREHDFYDLCKYNLMTTLYQNEGKFIETIQTGMGTLNLKLEDWASSADKKAELLKELLEYSTIHQISYAHFSNI